MARYQRSTNGKFLRCPSGQFASACPCEEEPPAPETCPCTTGAAWNDMVNGITTDCGGLKKLYKVEMYADGDIPTCASCFNATIEPVWDGGFEARLGFPCLWFVNETTSYAQDGKVMGNPTSSVNRMGGGAPGGWSIRLRCASISGEVDVVIANKTVGLTPVGIYTVTAGCSGLSSVSIIDG